MTEAKLLSSNFEKLNGAVYTVEGKQYLVSDALTFKIGKNNVELVFSIESEEMLSFKVPILRGEDRYYYGGVEASVNIMTFIEANIGLD